MKLGIKICIVACCIFSLQLHASEKNKQKISPVQQNKKPTFSPHYFTFNNNTSTATSPNALVRATSTLQHIQATQAQTSTTQSNSVSTKTSKAGTHGTHDVKKRDSSPDSSPDDSPEEKKQKLRPRHAQIPKATTAKEVVERRKKDKKHVNQTPEPSPTKPRPDVEMDLTDMKGNRLDIPLAVLQPQILNALKKNKKKKSNHGRLSIKGFSYSPTPTPSAMEHMAPSTPSEYSSWLVPTPHNVKPRFKNSISAHISAPQSKNIGETTNIETVDESCSDDDVETEA